jgi:hypothetical protein
MTRDSLFKELDETEKALESMSPKVSTYKKYIEKKKSLLKRIEKYNENR